MQISEITSHRHSYADLSKVVLLLNSHTSGSNYNYDVNWVNIQHCYVLHQQWPTTWLCWCIICTI